MLPTMVKMSISATSSELDSREAAILAFLSALAGSQATVFLTVHRLQRRRGMPTPRKLDADGGFHRSHYKEFRWKCQIDKIYESCCWSTLSFFVRCHEYYIFFGTDFAKKKRAGMGFWFPKPALIFYADICMMAKESTPSKTGHSLVAMLNSKRIGVKVVSNQRLHHL